MTTMSNDKTAEEIDHEFDQLEATLIRLFPPEKHGEDPDVCVIYDCAKALRDEAKRSAQQLKEYREVIRELLPFIEHQQGEQAHYFGSESLTAQLTLKKANRARKLIDQTDSTK